MLNLIITVCRYSHGKVMANDHYPLQVADVFPEEEKAAIPAG